MTPTLLRAALQRRGTARVRWWLLAVLVSAGFAATVQLLGWESIAGDWLLRAVRAASGGALGWFVSRYIVQLDLSALATEDRATAAISQAICIAGFAIAVA